MATGARTRASRNSTLVNSATWGLVIGRALVSESEQASALKRLIARAGEPFVRQAVGAAMRMMGEIFVMGRTIGEAIERMQKRENAGFTASFDMLGEAARTFPDAERYFQSYEDAIRAVGKVAERGPQHLGQALGAPPALRGRASTTAPCPALIEQVEALATLAAKLGIPFTIDAEETERLEMSLDIIEAVAGLPALKGWDGLGMAIQAYGKRARPTIAWADAIGAAHRPADRGRGWSRAPIGTPRSSAPRSRAWPTIPCSPARRRPTSPTSPARGTCWRRRTSIPPSPPTMR